MNKHLHSELKKEFQLERMILFSDAVFAIAITLLVLEIKVPEIAHNLVTEEKLQQALADLLPKFTGFLVSFLIIGLYWTVHHRLFGFVVNYNQRLLWLNLLFLLTVILMPFSTGFYSEYIMKMMKTPVIFYIANICLLGIMNFILCRYIGNPKHQLTEGLPKPLANYFAFRAIMIPIIFLFMAIAYRYVPKYAIWIPMFIPLLMVGVRKMFEKKLDAAMKSMQHAEEKNITQPIGEQQ